MSQVSIGADYSMVDRAVEELASSFKRTPPGASLRVPVRGTKRDEVMALAVKKLLEKFPTKLRAVKWEGSHGMEVQAGDGAAAYVTIMRTPDLYANFDKEQLEQLNAHRQILSADTAEDLDPELAFEVDPITPKVDLIVEKE